jgi:hypothetical protein
MRVSRSHRFLLLFLIFMMILLFSRYHWYAQDDTQFWYIEYIDEQLGKAKFHLLEQAFIANQLRRTLVLPNVGQSQIGMRYPYAFGFYYEAADLSRSFSTMAVRNFRFWRLQFAARRKTFTAALVYILLSGQCSKQRLTWYDVHSELWLRLQATHDIILLPKPACFETNYGWNAPRYPQPIIDHLRSTYLNTDIVVSVKNSHLFLMDPVEMSVSVLRHNRTLVRIAQAFARSRRPYVAVHWRMEGALGNGFECARTLVNATRPYSTSHAIYFSTDHPFRNELKSASFRSCCRPDLTKGYNHVLEYLHPLMLDDLPLQSIGSDSGSLAIVEKLICQYADVFLAGNAPCDRHGSFGREIIKYRQIIAQTPWSYWSHPNATYEPRKAYPW